MRFFIWLHIRLRKHIVDVRRVSVPAFDPSALGELWTCRDCPKVWAL